MKLEHKGTRISLNSDHWEISEDGRFLYWSSLGPAQVIPQTLLESKSYDQIEDDWAAIELLGSGVTLLADVPRSHPLFYALTDAGWLVTDSPQFLRTSLPEWQRDELQAEVFVRLGFTLNEGTLIKGVSAVESCSRVELLEDRQQADISFHDVPKYEHPGIDKEQRLDAVYREALDKVFADLLTRVGSRQLVVPLSGGLDSRLLVALLKSHAAKNVLTFTYGKPNTAEARVSESIAKSLGMAWVFVDSTVAEVTEAWFSAETDSFRSDTWSASALPHIQDWYALREFKARGLIDDDAVFLPGHTPVGCMHDEAILGTEPTLEDLGGVIANHHFLGRGSSAPLRKNPEFVRSIRSAASQIGPSERFEQDVIEWFNYRERQAKYINNSVLAYEHFGWDWALPLYWPTALQAWLRGSERLTATRGWYRSFVDRVFEEVAGSSQGYFEAPANASSGKLRETLVSLARKTGANEVFNRGWEIKVQLDHPLGLDLFTQNRSVAHRVGRLLKQRYLMATWATDFLEGSWGSAGQNLVPPPAGKDS